MKYKTLALTTLAATAALGAQQTLANDKMRGVYDNTVKFTRDADGKVILYYFHDDGTYTRDDGGGGRWWENRDGKYCGQPDGKEATCINVEWFRKVGDTWTGTDAQGRPGKFIVIEGR